MEKGIKNVHGKYTLHDMYSILSSPCVILRPSNRKYQAFLRLSYFPWLCAWGGCTIICCRFHICISLKSWSFCLLFLWSLMMCTNNKVHYDFMVIFVCLHITLSYYHYEDLYENIKVLKCLSGTICLEYVSKIKPILLVIFYVIYGAACIQLTHFSYDDCVNMYFILLSSSNRKYDPFAIV